MRRIALGIGALATVGAIALWARDDDDARRAAPAGDPVVSSTTPSPASEAGSQPRRQVPPPRPRFSPPARPAEPSLAAPTLPTQSAAAPTPPAPVAQDAGPDAAPLTPEEARAASTKAMRDLFKRGDYPEAAKQSMALLEQYPDSFEIRSVAVSSLCAMGETEDVPQIIAAQAGKKKRHRLRKWCHQLGGTP